MLIKYLQRLHEMNSPEDLMLSAALAAASFLVLYAVRGLIARRQARTAGDATGWHQVIAEVIASTHVLMLLSIAALIGLNNLDLPSRLEKIASHGFVLILLVQAGFWGRRGIHGWLAMRIRRAQETERGAAVMNYGVLAFVAETILWALLLLTALDNLGVNITTLVASLGIGGIAVALAVQNILGDLFASLSIALDKPFVAGDFIIVDDMLGTVQKVGLKTTRIQSLSGEELVISNADLLKSRIRNYKRMAERRIVFELKLHHDTPPGKLATARDIIAAAVREQGGARLDRAHFKAITPGSLDFEIVYYVLTPGYNEYMDIQQAINLAVLERLAAAGIAFALPVHDVHLRAPMLSEEPFPGATDLAL